ncbi:Hcp family type VI secretion system effector [Parachitinimonas caeni]|uniref:Type VI secretion system tube protein Hcp n=1 Tax=Parachitinimonas caeni TaxID=3031301 RepID=A0ABT7E5B1_9NEIS|nr:type VI secretion system tube protein Hcp [Parachitinimonas caeni]MDK2126548.1 type VI secretion system tube protein Hcp [Parachitinimonas caeni]
MASDIFLKIEGVQGESIDAAHSNEIEVLSFNWGMAQGSSMHTGTGGGSGKISVEDVTFTHFIDKSSPILIQHCFSGKHLPKAELTVRKAGNTPLDYFKVIMTDVMVTSVTAGGSNADGQRVVETVGLSFSKVEIEYQPQGKDGAAQGGKVKSGWDIKANKQV